MSIVPRAKTVLTNFLPTSIGGCQLWLDGADPAGNGVIPANGSDVLTWVDKSPNGYNATVAPSRVVGTYSTSLKAVNFATSSTGYITNYSAAPTNETMFVVFNNPSPSYSNNILIGGLQGARSLGAGYSGNGGQNANVVGNLNTQVAWLATTSGGSYPSGTTVIVTSEFTSSTNSISLNGGTYTSSGGAPGFTAGRVTYLGVDAANGSYYYIGYAMEIIFYNYILSTNQRQQVEGYLAQKWGLTASLPAGHPGLTQTFYGTARSTVIPIILLPFNIYANYNPLTATGSTCILWLDASDPTTLFSDAAGTTLATTSGTVGYWRDKSSSGFNAIQTTLSYRPTYVAAAKNGRSILSFNGLTNFLNMPQFTAVPLTIFFVAQGTVFLGNTFFLSLGSAGDTVMMRMLPSQLVYGVDGNDVNPITTIATTNADTNWHLWTLTISSTTVTFYFDGTLIGTSSWPKGSAYTFATNTIAAWNQQVGGKATTLRIPEILFYSAVLGTTQQREVESYLTEKWGLVPQPTRSVASIVAIPKISFASSGLVITHQDGRPWKLTGTAVALNAGTQMSLTIYAGGDVFNSANGRVGLFNNGSSSAAVRHAGYVMYANTFGANNYDWAWYFVSSGSKYLIYNDFPSIGSAWQVSYDPAQDRVLIVQPGDAKYGMLWTITPRVTLSYVYTSYPT